MEYRSKPYYLMRMRKEPVPEDIKGKLVSIYEDGGLKEFEKDIAPRMGKLPVEQIYYTDPITHENLKWIYVGDFWWCRKRNIIIEDGKKRRKKQYEFARLMAIMNRKNPIDLIMGLWDARIHEFKKDPIIVFKGDRKGVIVEYNEFEVVVQWCDDPKSRSLIREIDEISFKYMEDFKLFKRVFDNMRNYVKKII